MRRTKIVCTIGPASESVEILKQLIHNGMNVARLNFSHGTYDEHAARIRNIRQASEEVGKAVAIMLDIKGPKIRTGMVRDGAVELQNDQKIILTTEQIELGDEHRISISYEGLTEDVSPGSDLRIDDGLIGLVVEKIEGPDIHCRVTNGGTLKNRKGINAPGVKLRIESVTEKDIADIRFGIEQGVDLIAASFVRKASDVLDVRRILEEKGATQLIISKIETQEGLELIDEILEVTDGLMVARGDLGVEIPTEEVPLAQKMLISKCNKLGKPVITATQMLDSMERNPRPTRAEASDVANAIFDGTDAIMLSGETAAGKYPMEAVATMARIAERAEEALFGHLVSSRVSAFEAETGSVTDAMSHAVATVAKELKAHAIVTATSSGHTARMVSKHRPNAPIIATTDRDEVSRRLLLSWGVYPVLTKRAKTTDELLSVSVEGALASGLVEHGDLLVITAGVPVGQPGTTNMIKVHTIGEVLTRGQGIGHKAVSGRLLVSNKTEEILAIEEGDILVTHSTDRDIVPAFEKAAAVITVEGGLTSHAAVVGLSLGIPVIVGVQNATEDLKTGITVTVDPRTGLVYEGVAHVL
ncbi:pyruvate kinase [Tumebacillus permanentifrigoris]|uniref:Pyruvate kinase n=1 Tax=Tumebacillus permanentifrigoris TaxID=378543 RepID=A0A316D9L6_9BACL|nr:pyruvate kinase [Tumebacillus permanentifrigoris]PWK13875.1 pyruvate kinase [Tumebacillus permanentifrigoris]